MVWKVFVQHLGAQLLSNVLKVEADGSQLVHEQD